MNLLLTNDDGFGAEGLVALANRLSKEHNVYVIAPDGNRSAVSHHITMYSGNTVKKISETEYTCSGYPVDCVFAGVVSNLLDVKIDGVISGINTGSNIGTDIIYSGTCAAARQGVLHNVPSVAVSVGGDFDGTSWDKINFKYEAIADFVAKNLEKLLSLARLEPPRAFVNVNGAALDSYKGVKIANSLCVRRYGDSVKMNPKGENGSYQSEFVFGNNKTEDVAGTDYNICKNGYIAVSLVYADPLAKEYIDDTDFSL